MEPRSTAKKLAESIRLTLRDLEKNTDLAQDSRSTADLRSILLLHLSDLEAATVDEPALLDRSAKI
jgi:hypothetical protein